MVLELVLKKHYLARYSVLMPDGSSVRNQRAEFLATGDFDALENKLDKQTRDIQRNRPECFVYPTSLYNVSDGYEVESSWLEEEAAAYRAKKKALRLRIAK